MVRTDGHTLSEKRNYQVTNSMFGASRKKFVEGVDSDYHDENMYYSQSSVFPHRSEKDIQRKWLQLVAYSWSQNL
uniref:CCR4-NOT transcription complex subunit 2 n=1 Tax=Equus caballus TaxID=9796 RepID=A0A9L0RN34_HORSE